METKDRSLYRNTSIHISDRSHWNLTLNVYNCGNQDIEFEHVTRPDYYVFYFVREGKGYVTERQAAHKVAAGQGFVLFPNEEARIKSESGETMNVIWVAFSGYLVDQYLERARLTVYEPVFSDNSDREAEKLFERLLAAANTFSNRYCKIMAQLYSVFGFLIDNVIRASQPESITPEFYLIKALDYIEINYQNDISVEDIAASVGLNRKALYVVFKNLTGFAPKDYLTCYRMGKATVMLKDANLPIKTVAFSIGYNDQFHFSKEFKKNVGMSPSEYRREVLRDPSKEYQSPIDIVRQQYPMPPLPDVPPEL